MPLSVISADSHMDLIEEQFRGIPEAIQAKMLGEIVRRVYRIPA